MGLGNTIARLRKKQGLTQAELAAMLELHPTQLTRWEKDQVQPRTKALERLAGIFNTTVAEMLAGDFTGVSAALNDVDDPELTELLSHLHELDGEELAALKTMLRAMLTRLQVAQVVTTRNRLGARPAQPARRKSAS